MDVAIYKRRARLSLSAPVATKILTPSRAFHDHPALLDRISAAPKAQSGSLSTVLA